MADHCVEHEQYHDREIEILMGVTTPDHMNKSEFVSAFRCGCPWPVVSGSLGFPWIFFLGAWLPARARPRGSPLIHVCRRLFRGPGPGGTLLRPAHMQEVQVQPAALQLLV